MKIISLNCNHCGAPLDVSAKAKFVTCGFCDARLAIEHTGNSYSTAVLDELQAKTEKLERDVAEIKSNSDLESLDSEWDRIRERHMVTGKHGRKSLPTKGGAMLAGFLVCGFGIFWTIMACGITSAGRGMGAPGIVSIFPLFGVIFVIAGLFGAIHTHSKAEAYEKDLSRYQQKRRELVRFPEIETK